MLVIVGCVGVCGALGVTATKRTIPITVEDAKVMWALHKQNTGCIFKEWTLLTRNKGKMIGFQCECGYRFKQKKPIMR